MTFSMSISPTSVADIYMFGTLFIFISMTVGVSTSSGRLKEAVSSAERRSE